MTTVEEAPAEVGASTPSGIEIDGELYELPIFDSFDLDEAEILYEIAGVIQEQFAPLHPEATDEEKAVHANVGLRLIGHPRFKRALVHIAYRRKHPDVDFDEIEFKIGKVNSLDVTMEFLRGDDGPPALSSPRLQDDKRSTSETSSSGDSGTPSGSDSDARVVHLSPTGTGG